MNYKNNAIRELQDFSKEFPEYTLGELLYSTLRLTNVTKISDLLTLSDEDIFSAIEKTKQEEKENI
jgi:hypothetical protein